MYLLIDVAPDANPGYGEYIMLVLLPLDHRLYLVTTSRKLISLVNVCTLNSNPLDLRLFT